MNLDTLGLTKCHIERPLSLYQNLKQNYLIQATSAHHPILHHPLPFSLAHPPLCCEPLQQLTSLRMNNECDETFGSEVTCL